MLHGFAVTILCLFEPIFVEIDISQIIVGLRIVFLVPQRRSKALGRFVEPAERAERQAKAIVRFRIIGL